MRRIRGTARKLRRPSYAEVVATLALFIALGGASYAAIKIPKNSVGTKQLKKNAVTAKKLKKNAVTAKKLKKNAVNSKKVKDGSLLARDFKRGQLPQGATGPAGLPGAAGAAGQIGPTGPTGEQGLTGEVGASTTAVILGRSSVGTFTEYVFPSGVSEAVTSTGEATAVSPPVTVYARNLRVELTVAPGPSKGRYFALMADDQVAAACTISLLDMACQDTTTDFPIPPNSPIYFAANSISGPSPTDVMFSYTLGP